MQLGIVIVSGLKEIGANKVRAALSMLGIVLGVSSLVASSALVKGMENGMKEALVAIGGVEKVDVYETEVPAHQDHLADQAVGCTLRDVLALQQSAPLIRLVTPEIRLTDVVLTRGERSFVPWSFIGTSSTALEMNHQALSHGRMFSEVDDELARNVCVIGTAIRDALFGSPEQTGGEIIPIGERININSEPFTIIGLLQHCESQQERRERQQAAKKTSAGLRVLGITTPERRRAAHIFDNKNATIYAPLRTVRMKLRPVYDREDSINARLTSFSFQVCDVGLMEQSLQQAQNVLLQTHRGIADFALHTQENWDGTANQAARNARWSGGIIAAISLLVGGLNIVNIMLAGINERVREIGIRKAVGATSVHVFMEFLSESIVIALIGGLAGLVTAYSLVQILAALSPLENAPVITWEALALAFACSAAVGLLAGLMPSFRAARLNPVAAIRNE